MREHSIRSIEDAVRELSGRAVLLVRHGRTAYNIQRRFVGALDIPLDEVGLSQGRAVAKRLKALDPVAVFSSPLSRALQTAELIGDPRLVPGIVELDQGELEGLPAGSIDLAHFRDFKKAWDTDPENALCPGGESLGTCRDRALSALKELLKEDFPPGPVVVVSHQMVIASVLCTLDKKPLTEFRDYASKNTAVSLLELSPRGLEVVVSGDSSHLSP